MTVFVRDIAVVDAAAAVDSIAFDFLLNKMNFVASYFALNSNFGHVGTCD